MCRYNIQDAIFWYFIIQPHHQNNCQNKWYPLIHNIPTKFWNRMMYYYILYFSDIINFTLPILIYHICIVNSKIQKLPLYNLYLSTIYNIKWETPFENVPSTLIISATLYSTKCFANLVETPYHLISTHTHTYFLIPLHFECIISFSSVIIIVTGVVFVSVF